jgi:hypothetical protein
VLLIFQLLQAYFAVMLNFCVHLFHSEDERLSCGYASFRGKRASMEDFFDAKSSQIEGKVVNLFGIFDGTSLAGCFNF